MKLIPILGFLIVALSVPVLTFLGIALIASKTIPQLKNIQKYSFVSTTMPDERERQQNELAGEIFKQRDELNVFKDILARSKKPDDQRIFEKIEPLVDQTQKKLKALELQLKALDDSEADKRERQKNELPGEIFKQKHELDILKGILARFKKPDDQRIFEKIEPLVDQTQKKLETFELQLKALKEQEKAAQSNLPVQEQAIRLLRQTPSGELLKLIRIVSLFVFLAILALSRFLKSRFLRSSLLVGALATLIFGIIYNPVITLLLTLAILYTTRRIYEPLDCPL